MSLSQPTTAAANSITGEDFVVRSIHAYHTNQNGHLSFEAHQYIRVLHCDTSGWWLGECDTALGWFPSTHVERAPAGSETEITEEDYARIRSRLDGVETQFLGNAVLESRLGTALRGWRLSVSARSISSISGCPTNASNLPGPDFFGQPLLDLNISQDNRPDFVQEISLHVQELQDTAHMDSNRQYQLIVADIISCMKVMFICTNTLARESPVLQRHATLAKLRRSILKALGKMCANYRIADGTQSLVGQDTVSIAKQRRAAAEKLCIFGIQILTRTTSFMTRIKQLDALQAQEGGGLNDSTVQTSQFRVEAGVGFDTGANAGTCAGGTSAFGSLRPRKRVSRANSAKGFISFKPARQSRTDTAQKYLVAKNAVEYVFTDYMECLNRGIQTVDLDRLLRITFLASEPVAIFLADIEDMSARPPPVQLWNLEELTAYCSQLAATLNDLFGVIQDLKSDLEKEDPAKSYPVEGILTKLMAFTSDLLRCLVDMEQLFKGPVPATDPQSRAQDLNKPKSSSKAIDTCALLAGAQWDEEEGRSRNASEWSLSEFTEDNNRFSNLEDRSWNMKTSTDTATQSNGQSTNHSVCNVMTLNRKFVSLNALNSQYKNQAFSLPSRSSDSLPMHSTGLNDSSVTATASAAVYGEAYDFKGHAPEPLKHGHDSAVALMSEASTPHHSITTGQLICGKAFHGGTVIAVKEEDELDHDVNQDGITPKITKQIPVNRYRHTKSGEGAEENHRHCGIPSLRSSRKRRSTDTSIIEPTREISRVKSDTTSLIAPAPVESHVTRSEPLSQLIGVPLQNESTLSSSSIAAKSSSVKGIRVPLLSDVNAKPSLTPNIGNCSDAKPPRPLSPDDVVFNESNQLVSATLGAFVELITSHRTAADPSLVTTFFITFRLYSDPSEVASMLIQRFNMAAPPGLDVRQKKLWMQNKQERIQRSVLSALKSWIDDFWVPEKDQCAFNTLLTFSKGDLAKVLPIHATRLQESLAQLKANDMGARPQTLNKARSHDQLSRFQTPQIDPAPALGPEKRIYNDKKILSGGGHNANNSTSSSRIGIYRSSGLNNGYKSPPAPVVNKALLNALANDRTMRSVSVSEITPTELARQLTILMSKMYMDIPYLELLTRERPSCSKMAKTATEITTWIIETIVDESDLKKRVERIKYWIKVGEECLTLNNFDTLTAITCAIDSSPIHRLSATWEAFSSDFITRFQQLQQVVSTKYNYREYRARLKAINQGQPCVPFLGLFLTAVTHIADGNAAYHDVEVNTATTTSTTTESRLRTRDDGQKSVVGVTVVRPRATRLIRYCRYNYLANTVQEFRRFQNKYDLLEVPRLREYILRCLQGQDWQRNIIKSNTIEPTGSNFASGSSGFQRLIQGKHGKGGVFRRPSSGSSSRASAFGFLGSIGASNGINISNTNNGNSCNANSYSSNNSKSRHRGMTIFRRKTPTTAPVPAAPTSTPPLSTLSTLSSLPTTPGAPPREYLSSLSGSEAMAPVPAVKRTRKLSIFQARSREDQPDQPIDAPPADTGSPLVFPPLTHQRLENCSFSTWYPLFRSISIKSKIIPLSEEFVSYLNADKVFIPGQSGVSLALSDSDDSDDDDQISDMEKFRAIQEATTHRQALDSDSEDEADEDEDEEEDASWIATTNTLKCHNAADIFLLLKSSDFIAHDLAHAYEDCSDEHGEAGSGIRSRPEKVELILRKWFDLAPSMEFRCFVRDNKLIGISQRDMTFYEFLKDIREELEEKIVDFFEERIKGKFPDADYTFDVYITRNRERIYLIDFNPFAQKTDSLLFQWEELLTSQERLPLRLLPSEEAGRHMQQPFSFNRYPSDVTDLSNGQTVAEFAEAFYKKVQASAV
ncbi:hypothetical protein BG004_004479 [Podila humilis]|nr:hypothetical protein BG004_004479 [Podila humilis]